MDRRGRVDVVAAQAHGVRDRAGLTRDQTQHAAWTVAPGVQAGGARAVALLLAVAWGSKLPLMPWKVPGIPWLLDRCYEFVARRRFRILGDTPWCRAHPGRCEPPA